VPLRAMTASMPNVSLGIVAVQGAPSKSIAKLVEMVCKTKLRWRHAAAAADSSRRSRLRTASCSPLVDNSVRLPNDRDSSGVDLAVLARETRSCYFPQESSAIRLEKHVRTSQRTL
jgi:hypothetical protein